MSFTENNTLIGFHGCASTCVPEIKAQNFRISSGEHHWLGEGVYFFIAGISNPLDDAKNWAIAQAWNNNTKTYTYRKHSVLKTEIQPRNPFDMTSDENKTKVNKARDLLIKRMKAIGGYSDYEIIQFLANEYKFDVVIQDFYIKFSKARRSRIESRYPNVRVLCVRDPESTIDKDKIDEIYAGFIS